DQQAGTGAGARRAVCRVSPRPVGCAAESAGALPVGRVATGTDPVRRAAAVRVRDVRVSQLLCGMRQSSPVITT
ncbi:hypothetical protein PV367_46585, partial [Streptomyces europaeiscabiei]